MRLIAKLLMLLVSVVVYAALEDDTRGNGGMVASIAIVAGLSFVATLVHELGHAAAVLGGKGRIQSIMVLPVELRLRPTRLLYASRIRSGDLGGFVRYTPGSFDSARRRLGIAAAGPVANLVLAVLAAVIANGLLDGSFVQGVLIALALLSGGMGLANLIPFNGSDGAHIIQAARRMVAPARRRT